MKVNDNKIIEKIEDLAVIKAILIQLVHCVKNGGAIPVIPLLNDTAFTDTLSDVIEASTKNNKGLAV